jgi:hypothetical protein
MCEPNERGSDGDAGYPPGPVIFVRTGRKRNPAPVGICVAFSDGGDLGFNAPVVMIPHDDYRKLILRLTFQTPQAALDLSHHAPYL